MIIFRSDVQVAHATAGHAVLVPVRVESKTALLAFLKDALHLPAYFGGNWDALEECLRELAAKGDTLTIVIHHDLPMESEPEEQRTYLQILGGTARASTHLDVVFPETYRDLVERTFLLFPPRA